MALTPRELLRAAEHVEQIHNRPPPTAGGFMRSLGRLLGIMFAVVLPVASSPALVILVVGPPVNIGPQFYEAVAQLIPVFFLAWIVAYRLGYAPLLGFPYRLLVMSIVFGLAVVGEVSALGALAAQSYEDYFQLAIAGLIAIFITACLMVAERIRAARRG